MGNRTISREARTTKKTSSKNTKRSSRSTKSSRKPGRLIAVVDVDIFSLNCNSQDTDFSMRGLCNSPTTSGGSNSRYQRKLSYPTNSKECEVSGNQQTCGTPECKGISPPAISECNTPKQTPYLMSDSGKILKSPSTSTAVQQAIEKGAKWFDYKFFARCKKKSCRDNLMEMHLKTLKTKMLDIPSVSRQTVKSNRKRFIDPRGEFLQEIAKAISGDGTEAKNRREFLLGSGLTQKQLETLSKGRGLKGYQVHHKIPLQFGGRNEVNNFILISTKYHQLFTAYQKHVLSKITKDIKRVAWPVIRGKGIIETEDQENKYKIYNMIFLPCEKIPKQEYNDFIGYKQQSVDGDISSSEEMDDL